MPNTILVTAVAKNGLYYTDCPTKIHLPCPVGAQIDAFDWNIVSDQFQQGWLVPPQLAEAEDSAVGFPVARVVLLDGTEYLIIADLGEGDTVNQLIADACSGCCSDDSPPVEPEVVATPADIIPTLNPVGDGIINQNCTTGECTYGYEELLPDDAVGLLYTVSFICGSTKATSTPVATIAAALAYAQANWPSYGTWSLDGNVLKVVGTTCKAGTVSYELQDQTFTLDFANDGTDTFNQVKNNGYVVGVGNTLTASDMAALIITLQPYFGDGTLSVSSEGNNTISYTGTGIPNDVRLDGVVVSSWS